MYMRNIKYINFCLAALLAFTLLASCSTLPSDKQLKLIAFPITTRDVKTRTGTNRLTNKSCADVMYHDDFEVIPRPEKYFIIGSAPYEMCLITDDKDEIFSHPPLFEKDMKSRSFRINVFDKGEFPVRELKIDSTLKDQLFEVYDSEDYLCVLDGSEVPKAIGISYISKEDDDVTIRSRYFYKDDPFVIHKGEITYKNGNYSEYKEGTILYIDTNMDFEIWSPEDNEYKMVLSKKLTDSDDTDEYVGLSQMLEALKK